MEQLLDELLTKLEGAFAFVRAFGKTLWTGSWTTGSITVPNTADYSTFLVKFASTWMIAVKYPDNSRAVGSLFFVSNNGETIYQNQFAANISGNVWSFLSQTQFGHRSLGAHADLVNINSGLVVEEIIGLTPILSQFLGGGTA